ncbi:MAG: CRISPR-associated helicase Cas3' [Magnetococcales bacterium]|nr:CRISPR-associated helicase Cas3' [Nitrospirota bacterium]
MTSKINILAKSKHAITLSHHTKGLLTQSESLKKAFKPYLPDNDEFRNFPDLLDVAIFAHDLGKVSSTFQLNVGNWHYRPRIPLPNVPHSIFSLFWLDYEKIRKRFNNDKDVKILYSAIAFHHWRDNFEQMLFGLSSELTKTAKILLENEAYRAALLQNLREHFDGNSDFKKLPELIGFNEDLAHTLKDRNDLFAYVVPPYSHNFLFQRSFNFPQATYLKKWLLLSGFLMRLDHFTSYVQDENTDELIENEIDATHVRTNVLRGLLKKTPTPWQQQELSDDDNGNSIILVAPTGAGKTEFAYLWGADSKLFFTLPLKTAVNSIFDRTETVYGRDNVGLLHSDADLYILEKSGYNNHNDLQSQHEAMEGERPQILQMARHLSLAATVSTGDQIFPATLKYPGYEKIYATLLYSKLVIDEVQAYNPEAVAMIVKLLEDIAVLGGKFLLMTATLPDFVHSEIEKRTKAHYKYIDKYVGVMCVKHKVAIRAGDIEDDSIIADIIQKARGKHRTLVIANTVHKAQGIYKSLKGKLDAADNITMLLLHSRFVLKKRQHVEAQIAGKGGLFANPGGGNDATGVILVATQVVEASLDIDADILYTELAPLDCLVQRMGRVFRRYAYDSGFRYNEKEPPNVIVCFNNGQQENKKETILESGKGYVYEKLICALSLALLVNSGNNKIKEVDDFITKVKDTAEKDNVQIKINKEIDNFISAPAKLEVSFLLPEIRKKGLVGELYDLVPETSAYKRKFAQALSLLDSGYMSERKEEALRTFRNICTISGIPSALEGTLKEALETFIDTHDDDNFRYVSFKNEVLSRVVVNVRPVLMTERPKRASTILYELRNCKVEEKKFNRLNHWLDDILIFDAMYCEETGLETKTDNTKVRKDNIS